MGLITYPVRIRSKSLLQISPNQVVDITLQGPALSRQFDFELLKKAFLKLYRDLPPLYLDCSIVLVITRTLLVFTSFLAACCYIE